MTKEKNWAEGSAHACSGIDINWDEELMNEIELVPERWQEMNTIWMPL